MNDRLLAPQFGLQRRLAAELQALENPLPEFRSASPAPVIIVKRKRLLEQPALEAATAAETEPAIDEAPLPRPPKVFHLDPKPAETIGSSAEVPQPPEEPLVPVVPLRRPRDPVKAPVLLQHVIFETEPAVAPSLGSEPLREYKEVMTQLQQLHKKVTRYMEGQAVFERLEAAIDRVRQARAHSEEPSAEGSPPAP